MNEIEPLDPPQYPRKQEQKKEPQKEPAWQTDEVQPMDPYPYMRKPASIPSKPITLKSMDGDGPVQDKAQQLYDIFGTWLAESNSTLLGLQFTEIMDVVEELAGGPYSVDNPPQPPWIGGSINQAVQRIMEDRRSQLK